MAWGTPVGRADSLGPNGGTSAGLNTTGCDTLWLAVSTDSGVTLVAGDISDSRSNTWALLGTTPAGGFCRIHLFYAKNASVGAGHTITVTKTSCYAATVFAANSGGDLSAPTDADAGNSTTGTSIAAGITASANTITITALADDNGGTITDPAGYTRIANQAHIGATSYGVTMAYKQTAGGGSETPSWGTSSSTGIATRTSSFKEAGGVGGGTTYSGCDGTGCF